MNSSISELDSKRFGFKIAKIEDFGSSPEMVLEDIRNEGVKLIITRIDCEQIELINKLEQLGFRIMDFQLNYKYELKNYVENKDDFISEFTVRNATPSDIESLKKIATESFYQYGHYFADTRLDKIKCTEIYVDWIVRSVENKEVADIVFVAEMNHVIAGFLSFKIKKDNVLYAAGVQGAVSEKFRNRNVFKNLIIQGLKWGYGLNLNWEEHNVLLTNYPVNRSFIKTGFIPVKSYVTLHGWIDK